MKKRVITVGLLMMSGLAFSQVGIGTRAPHKSALLELKSDIPGEYRGLLIPRVPLTGLEDRTTINKGNVLESLLVYNTTNENGLTPGFYYWKKVEWARLLDSKDLISNVEKYPHNKVLEVRGNELVLEDSNGGLVNESLQKINIVTTIKETEKGKYVYTSEDGTQTTIDIVGSVVDNITEILKENTVKEEIYNTVAANGKAATAKDGSIQIDNGDKAVLNEMQISVANKGITPAKLAPGTRVGQFLVTNVNGDVQWLDATEELIQEALHKNERVTLLQDGKNGTFTYYNEEAIDAKTGAPIQGKGIRFDANTLRIVERKTEKEKGIYDFYDGLTSLDHPLMTISTRANAIYFDNNTSIEGDNLQVVIDNIINKIEAAQGKPADLKGNGILINNDTVLAGAVLKEVMLSIGLGAVESKHLANDAVTKDKLRKGAVITDKIENKAVTTAKIAPGVDKQILVTKDNKVEWVPVTDDIIVDIVKTHEIVTLVVNNHDGTYSYYNEKGIDKDGNPIESQGELIDANTLSITEDPKGKGKYIFEDGTGVIAIIDIKSTIINNIDEILGDTNVQNSIYATIAAKGQKLSGDKAIKVTGDGKEVLSAATLSLNDNSIEPKKLEKGANKTFLVTTSAGEVKWVSADDKDVEDILKLKETVTVLENKGKGIYTYYNEDVVKAGGTQGVDIDVNSLTIDDNKKGVFVFKDLSSDDALATIDIPQEVIKNISLILNDGDVKNEITAIIKASAKDLTNADSSIFVETGEGAVLVDTKISVAEGGIGKTKLAAAAVTTDKLDNAAVTTAKLDNAAVTTAKLDDAAVTTAKLDDAVVTPAKLAAGEAKTFLVTTGSGDVKWIKADDKEVEDILKLKETVTVLEDLGTGMFVYRNETDIKEGKAGITFDANTLRIVEREDKAGKGIGVYDFYDKSKTTPIGTIDVPASVIGNITAILNNPTVQLEISKVIDAKAQNVVSSDKSIAVTGGDKAALKYLTLNIAEGGVTTNKISSKVNGVNAEEGTVLTAKGDGTVAFSTATESVAPAMQKDLTGEESVINVSGGKNILYGNDGEEAVISINPGGITSNHIQNETIVNGDIAPKTIQADRLDATGETEGYVATVQNDGTVSYEALTSASITDKGDIKTSDGITVADGKGKTLGDVTLGLEDNKVSPKKLTPGTESYLLVTREGQAQWVAATDAIIDDAVKQKETVTILENKGKGIYNYRNEDDIKNNGVGVNIDVNSLTIDDSKPGVYIFKDLSENNLATIDIERDVINSIVTILGDTNVKEEIYKIVAAQGKAITSDGSLTIPQNKAGLEGVELKIATDGVKTDHIANGQVTAAKLGADKTLEGNVATVNADGTVSYKPVTSTEVSAKAAALKTDGIILVGDPTGTTPTEQTGTLFKEATLSIKAKGIDTAQLADSAVENAQIATGAVTIDKISSTIEDKGKVMMTDDNGDVKWVELDVLADEAAGTLTTDNIIEISNGNGDKALFKDVAIGIAENSITNQKIKDQTIEIGKLSSEGSKLGGGVEAGMVMVTNANGGFEYVGKETITQQGADLTLGSELEFTLGNGESAMITETGIGIKNKGINTAKLADSAVTTTKMSSKVGTENADENSVLTAKGDGTVEYKKINSAAFEGSEGNLLSDGSLDIPADNKAVLKDMTIGIADDGVKTDHILNAAVTTAKIADEQITAAKIKGEAPKQLLITNDGAKAEWVDASNLIIKEIVNSNESITLLIDNGKGTFTYKNEDDIKNGGDGVTFDANTLKIDKSKPGIYVFSDGNGELATINIAEDVIHSITTILGDTNVQNTIYQIVSNLGKKVSTDDSIAVTGGEKAVLHPMTISLKDGGVNTKKITSTVEGINSSEGTVLSADGQGNVVFKPLSEVATTQGKAISSKGKSLTIKGNKAALEALNLDVAEGGIKTEHLQDKSVTVEKIKTNEPAGKVLTSTGDGAEFRTLGEVVGSSGKEIKGDTAIAVKGGEHAALTEVSLSLNNSSITEEKLANEAVTRDKIKNKEITAAKMAGEIKQTILVTDNTGTVKWADANDTVIGDIVGHTESLTVLRDNKDGTFTYFNENEVDNKGNVNEKAEGVTFDANTVTVDSTTTKGVYVFKDHAGKNTLTTIDTRASKIIFEGDVKYENVEVAITDILNTINEIQQGEIPKANLTGVGPIKVTDGEQSVLKAVTLDINAASIGEDHLADNAVKTAKIADNTVTVSKLNAENADENSVLTAKGDGTVEYKKINSAAFEGSEANLLSDGSLDIPLDNKAVLKEMTIGIANDGVTTAKIADEQVTAAKIKGEAPKQLLITNDGAKAEWVDASNLIIKEIVNSNESITLLTDKGNGTFTYQNEKDIKEGKPGVLFDANTLSIDTNVPGEYVFSDGNGELATINVAEDVINSITTILGDTNVQNTIYQIVSSLGKKVSTDDSIAVTGGEKAVLHPMTISLKDDGVTKEKIKQFAVTEDKLFAGQDKENFVPVVQGDGTVKYQPMNTVVAGKMLSVDNSLSITGDGDASRALLEELGLQVNEKGIGNEHLQSLAVTVDKLSSRKEGVENYAKGDVLIADGSGNVEYVHSREVVNKATQGDLVGEKDVVKIDGGENVLFGDENKKVTVSINKGGIKGGKDGHLAAATVTGTNLVDKAVSAAKLDGGNAAIGTVATVGEKGSVSYQSLTPSIITGKGTINVTDGLTVDNGAESVLKNLTLGIANNAIDVSKFDAGNAVAGSVATVSNNGKSVTYEPLTTDKLGNKGDITTDGVVTVNDGKEKVLSNVVLGIGEGKIDTTHIANGAVTSEKLVDHAVTAAKMSSEGIGEKRILVSGPDNTVVWKEMGDFEEISSGDLKTDSIITMSTDGKGTILKDLTLGIADNSIGIDKLNSKSEIDGMLLVADGEGGFRFKKAEDASVVTKNLTLGDALTFTNGSTGIDAVLDTTSFDVKDEGISTAKLQDAAVTVAKMNAEAAPENSVLTAKGEGKVAFEQLSSTVFEGKGANLLTDSSIKIVAGGQGALLKETNIAIADKGVKTAHIDDNQVTAAKINPEKSAQGTVLTVDNKGKAVFQALSDVATTQGKAITSTDGSLAVQADNKAALQDVNIAIANGGVKNEHIAAQQVTQDKIGTDGVGGGLLLTSDGHGGAEFKNAEEALSEVGKELKGGTGIVISGVGKNHALLGDAMVSIKQEGVSDLELANNAVTTEKIANTNVTVGKLSSKKDKSTNYTKGFVLTADGNGKVAFEKPTGGDVEKKNLTGAGPVSVTNGVGAVLEAVTLDIKDQSILRNHIKDYAVSREKILDYAVHREHLQDHVINDEKLANDAVISITIKDGAVTTAKISNGAVTNDKIVAKAVSPEKLSSTLDTGVVKEGLVLTADGKGAVVFAEPAAAGSSVEKKNITASTTIVATKGAMGSVMEEVQLDINEGSIESKHIKNRSIKNNDIGELQIDEKHIYPSNILEKHLGLNAVSTGKIKDGAVTEGKIKDGSVTRGKIAANAVSTTQLVNKAVSPEKLSSTLATGNVTKGQVLTADGDGNVKFEEPKSTGSNVTKKNITESTTIMATKGAKGSVMEEVQLDIKGGSIRTEHIATSAVDSKQIRNGAVKDDIIQAKGVDSSKISSEGVDTAGYVLTADGSGGASWQQVETPKEVKAAMPKFFYAPSFYISVDPGERAQINIYEEYLEQFGKPKAVNQNAQSKTLPVLNANELDYYVLYYDDNVFETVSIDDEGQLKYEVKATAEVGTNTYFNIVFGVRE
ncbi:hypothetical protein [Myroides sp.]|uniref:hypothetical protein n=1 Tax=Myroides sp. TaxID=1874736 RepID=UPI003F3F0715